MTITLQISLFENAITRTQTVITGLLSGTIPESLGIESWQSQMRSLGLLPPIITPPSGTIVEGITLSELQINVVDVLEAFIDAEFDRARAGAFNNLLVVIDTIERVEDNIINSIDDGVNSVNNTINNQTSLILSRINLNNLQTLNAIDNVTRNVAQLFINQSNRIESFRSIQTQQIVDKINVDTNTILSSINNIRIINGGNGVPQDTGIALDDVEGYIFDFLGILSDIRNFIQNKDFSPTIENNITVEGGVGGVVFDEQGNPAFDLLQLGLADLFSAFANDVNLNIGADVQNYGGDVLGIIRGWGKGEFQSIEELELALKNTGIGGNLFKIVWGVLGGLFELMGLGSAVSRPYLNNIETLARKDARDGLIPLNSLVESWIRDLMDKELILDNVAKIGLKSNDFITIVRNAQVQLQDYYLRDLFLRTEITETEHDEGMEKLGYKLNDIPLIRETYKTIPPIQDLITFMKRDVYDDESALELGWDDEYDLFLPRFEDDLAKHGVSPEFAKLYYRASWTMPSPQQGFEMFQRGIIDSDKLQRLLRILDFPLKWRENMTQLNYKLLTRVDIRRMNRMGFITDEDLPTHYQSWGLSPDDAILMADWTIAYNKGGLDGGDKELTKTQILKSLKVGVIDETKARELLTKIGYSSDAIDIMVEISNLENTADVTIDVTADNRRRIIASVSKGYIQGILNEVKAKEYLIVAGYTPTDIVIELSTLKIERAMLLQQETIEQIKDRYTNFRISTLETQSQLQINGFSEVEQFDVLKQWDILRADDVKTPTIATITRWVKAGTIDRERYERYLKEMNYDSESISYFVLETITPT